MPYVKKSLLISVEGNKPIHPRAVAASEDAIVVAGQAGSRGWATKINRDGKPLWHYFTAESVDHKSRQTPDPIMTAIAISPADSITYLCGYLPTEPELYQSSLVVAINNAGNKLFEHEIIPAGRPARGLSTINKCGLLDGKLIIQGSAIDWSPTSTGKSISSEFYWLAAINQDGTVAWERLVPQDARVASAATFNMTIKSGEIFVAAQNVGTEILRFDGDGTLLKRLYVSKTYKIVDSIDRNDLDLIEFEYIQGERFMSLASLDEDLAISTKIERQKVDYFSYASFLYGQSRLILFGALGRNLLHGQISQVISFDLTSGHEKFIELPRSDPSFGDSGAVRAVGHNIATNRREEFIAARGLRIDQESSRGQSDDDSRSHVMGAEVDIIDID